MSSSNSHSPFRSKQESILMGYAQRRATIRKAVQKLQKLKQEYQAALAALEESNPLSLDSEDLDEVNRMGKELSEAGNFIWSEQEALTALTEHLSKLLPYATEDLLRRGNKIIMGGDRGEGEAAYLVCYEPEFVYTQEYIVEGLSYGQDVADIQADTWRMLTIEQLLADENVKHALPFR